MSGQDRRRNAALRCTRYLLLPKLIYGEVDVSETDIGFLEEGEAWGEPGNAAPQCGKFADDGDQSRKSRSGERRSQGWYSRGCLPHFDSPHVIQHITYHLLEWMVMPNHCQILFEPFEGVPLGKIVLSRKNYTARVIDEWWHPI